jgi:hypothetical protein
LNEGVRLTSTLLGILVGRNGGAVWTMAHNVTWYNHIVAGQEYSPLKELDLTWKVIWEQMMATFIVTGMMVGVVLIIVFALPGFVDIEGGIRLFYR